MSYNGHSNHSPSHHAPAQTSRSSYPSFLPFRYTAQLQIVAILKGILHASRWDIFVRLVASDPEIRSNVFKSALLNTLSLLSVSFLDHLLAPFAAGQQKWLHRNVGWFYQVLWLLPVVGASFYLNSSWCNLIAKRSYTLQYGSRASASPPSTYTGILHSVATSAYRVIMVFTSVVVSFSMGYIPVFGSSASFVFLCWVDAYYCFEFIWIARGHSLSRRLRHLEERWAYYLGFGLPSAALCMWGSTLANAAIFALLFPSYVIMAIHARPEPLDPYNPAGGDVVLHPSPYVPIRLPIFAPVTFLNDWIIKIVGVGGRVSGHLAGAAPARPSHYRRSSDNDESVEEGSARLRETISGRASHPPGRPKIRLGGSNMGTDRRKRE